MMSKTSAAVVAAAVLCGLSVSAAAFTSAPAVTTQFESKFHRVTFWGHPFPYGYTWSVVRACTRYVPVETPDGRTRWQRIWVCADRRHYFPRR